VGRGEENCGGGEEVGEIGQFSIISIFSIFYLCCNYYNDKNL